LNPWEPDAVQEHVVRFRALGSECLVRVVVADDDPTGPMLVDGARALLADLEARWSRFRPGSELNRLNAHAGSPVFTSEETAHVVAMAIEAWRMTGGLFDPTVLDALVVSGYDRTFEDLRAGPDVAPAQTTTAAVPGPAGIEVDERIGLVVLPDGCHLDLGGIGKGRAADLVIDRLLAAGALGACVDLGGDVRVGGSTPGAGDDWVVAVDDPLEPGRDLALLRLAAGAVTTSSSARRRWSTSAGTAHHLIDPTTGRSASSGLVAVTVVAASAAWGEVHAKAAVVAGLDRGRTLIEDAGMAGILVADDGTIATAGPIESFLIPSESP
jgi:thiamine biosynthesis lipoprotein